MYMTSCLMCQCLPELWLALWCCADVETVAKLDHTESSFAAWLMQVLDLFLIVSSNLKSVLECLWYFLFLQIFPVINVSGLWRSVDQGIVVQMLSKKLDTFSQVISHFQQFHHSYICWTKLFYFNPVFIDLGTSDHGQCQAVMQNWITQHPYSFSPQQCWCLFGTYCNSYVQFVPTRLSSMLTCWRGIWWCRKTQFSRSECGWTSMQGSYSTSQRPWKFLLSTKWKIWESAAMVSGKHIEKPEKLCEGFLN